MMQFLNRLNCRSGFRLMKALMTKKRFCLLLVTMALLLSLFPVKASAADAIPQEDLKALLNSIELHPQPTGYGEVDGMMEAILAPYATADTYTRVKAAYDWVIQNVDYSWAPYSQDWAPAYDCFNVIHDLRYDDPGLQEVVPFETVNRSYHAMKFGVGVCYDYAAAFALLVRYIGIDAYIHTGNFKIEPTFGTTTGHHGWTELLINGKYYIFDPQRDYRWSWDATAPIPYYYFGVPYENAWCYTQETQINAARDAQFLPVAQERAYTPVITVWATASGMASGTGSYEIGETVTVHAWGDRFVGWYDLEGKLLSNANPYHFPAEKTMVIRAVFANELFTDIPDNAWYRDNAIEAAARGLINGTSAFTFSAHTPVSRAMAITMLFRASKEEAPGSTSGFTDVPEGVWYADSVQWAVERQIVNGMGGGCFCPEINVTREQFAVMLMRYAAHMGLELPTGLPHATDSDKISSYALEAMGQAQCLGILQGYPDESLRPLAQVSRAEAVTMLLRLLEQIEAQ